MCTFAWARMYSSQGARRVFCILPRICYLGSNVSANSHLKKPPWAARIQSLGFADVQVHGYGSVPDTEHQKSLKPDDVLAFIQSSLHHPRGDSHFWFNMNAVTGNILKENGISLVLLGFGFTVYRAYVFSDISTNALWRIMKEYVTFSILFCNKSVIEMENLPCYMICDGLKNHVVYPIDSVDIKLLDSAIKDLHTRNLKGATVDVLKGSWVKPPLAAKEPDVCSALRTLLFSFPGCISADETGNRLFISDVNHHRITVVDSDGKFIDAIGSSPGYEDGDFENAKLMRPAASLYDASQDILYFADSENHAIRRADMSKRTVETVFQSNGGSTKSKGLWNQIMSRLWKKRNLSSNYQELNSESFSFPWHLLKSSDNDIFVLNQCCELLWIIDLKSGLLREVVKESSKILEICQQTIQDKCMPLSNIPTDWLQHQLALSCPTNGVPYGALVSSFAEHRDHIIFCDAVGQSIVKFEKGSTSPEHFEFSNFGVLGIPYWIGTSLEKVYSNHDTPDPDHSQSFNLKPGTVNIELNVNIPRGTRLIEHPKEGSVWCQTRGAAFEVSGVENKTQALEKVSLAQQWYDELDNLVFEQEESNQQIIEPDEPISEEMQDGKVQIRCKIKISPGTSEAIIHATLYLKLQDSEDSPEKKAETIGEILEWKSRSKRDLLTRSLLASGRAIEEIIFVKTLDVRLKFSAEDHPKTENTKGIVFTDSSVEVEVML